MKLLCDANLGRRLAQKLGEAGHDVVRSIHRIRHDARDEQVLALAAFEDRILITCDSDFGELVFLAGEPPPPAIIYVRFEPDDVEDIAPRILAALDRDGIEGHMVVIGDFADRRTKFPEER